MYYVIHQNTVDQVTKEQLESRINEKYYGDGLVFDSMPKDKDTNYWGDGILIIKGDLISPIAVTTVTKYEVE